MWDWDELWQHFGDVPELDFSEIPEMAPPLLEMPLTPDFSWSPEEILSDWSPEDLLTQLQNVGGSGSGGAGTSAGGLGGLMQTLFGQSSGKGSLVGDLLPLLSIIGALGGGINAMNKTEDATKQLTDAANKANEQATGLIGGARGDYAPYMQAGQGALSQLQGMLGGPKKQYGPVTAGAMKPIHGAMTLQQLAGRR